MAGTTNTHKEKVMNYKNESLADMLLDAEAISAELHWHQGDPHDVVDALDL